MTAPSPDSHQISPRAKRFERCQGMPDHDNRLAGLRCRCELPVDL